MLAALSRSARTSANNIRLARGLASKNDQTALFDKLARENPAVIQATLATADAIGLTGATNPSPEQLPKLGEQYVNLKAALSYTDGAVSKARVSPAAASLRPAPVRVAITGPAGAIGYSLCFRVASGELLGPNQPVILSLIEIEPMMNSLQGVVMELKDCAFPLVAGIETSSNVEKGFAGADYALLVGSKPRSKGMERGDLLKENGKIFVSQGQALGKHASKDVKVVVVGNPANTNCLIAAHNSGGLNPNNFTALTRLDHDRALAQIAGKVNCHTTDIQNLCIWGNHSATQYPDLTNATVHGKKVPQLINDDKWVRSDFIPTVQKRGAAIIEARGASSAASAANAAIFHIRDWVNGTAGQWTSMAVPSGSEYGVGAGVYFSYPVVCANGEYNIVKDVPLTPFSKEMIEKTKKELFDERDMVKGLLK